MMGIKETLLKVAAAPLVGAGEGIKTVVDLVQMGQAHPHTPFDTELERQLGITYAMPIPRRRLNQWVFKQNPLSCARAKVHS